MPIRLLQRRSGMLCMIVVVGLVMVGLWPFILWINQVHWLDDGPGLRFRPGGMAHTPEPLALTRRSATSSLPAAVTIQLWLQPVLEPNDDVYHILTIYDGRLPAGLTLCQWKTSLLLRIPADTQRGFRERGVGGALEKQKTRLITMTCGSAGTAWYLDGKLAESSPGFTVLADAFDGRLILGDSAAGKHTWSGQLFGLAIVNRTLDGDEVLKMSQSWTNQTAAELVNTPDLETLLFFNEQEGQWLKDQSPNHHDVFIPTCYTALHKSVLRWPAGIKSLVTRDAWINVLGFVPFGFLIYWHRRSIRAGHRLRCAGFAIITGAAISLFIEVIQIWLPQRDSSSLDLACNVLGTMLGVALAVLAERRFCRGRAELARCSIGTRT